MTQELGRVERPFTASFRGKRKLFLVPRLYEPPDDVEEGIGILEKYWVQVQAHVESLESGLGPIKHIYHEGLTEGGENGLGYLENIDHRCHAFVYAKSQSGAILEATEDAEILGETLDLQRCLMLPFTNNKVAMHIHDWFNDSVRRRYEHVSKRIDETLTENGIALLIINERHQVQFPDDVDVFFVAPPALDEFRRWVDTWLAKQKSASVENDLDSEYSNDHASGSAG